MTLENSELSRRKLLRTTAIGVPAAGLLAFGSTLVTAPSANAIDVDGSGVRRPRQVFRSF